MASSAIPAAAAPSRISYARARLLLGISGVGASVLVAAALLVFGIPARLLSTSAEQPLLQAVTSVGTLLLVGVIAFIPFDVLGGARIVRHRPSIMVFIARWARGAAVQLAVWVLAIALLMLAARAGGVVAAFAAFVGLQFILASFRAPMMRAIASFQSMEVPERVSTAAQRAGIAAHKLIMINTPDEGFVGGWSGIVPRRLLLPARWLELPDEALVAALRRRQIIAESGAHLRGVLGAIAWNSVGFAATLALTGADLSAAAGVLTVAAAMTLWAFVGVLVLPTASRAAVYAVDRAAAETHGTPALRSAIEHLDRWQDDEERRSARVETIFHPVPARSARLARLGAINGNESVMGPWHAHHLARHALWLGWGTMSPLSRAVHCNVGRPALWAMLPGD